MLTIYKESSDCNQGPETSTVKDKLLTILLVFTVVVMMTSAVQVAQAQTYNVIYNFTGQADGGQPFSGVTVDAGSVLYGTTFAGGGIGRFGTIFRLRNSGSGWVLNPLYAFRGGSDGAGPVARPVVGPDGALYGSTSAGGGYTCLNVSGYDGCGTIYKLVPLSHESPLVLSTWLSNTLYRFSGSDGSYPQGDLTFDSSGNIYGVATAGGSAAYGLIYSLTSSGGQWTENILYQAQGDGDGEYPWGGVTFDQSGNLYGVFLQNGPYSYGAIYKLAPSGSGWTESTVHGFTFQGHDGATPQGGLISDPSGNLYGTTVHSPGGGGTVFELTSQGGGNWSYNYLYGLSGGIDLGPQDKLVMDSNGNLYGTTFGDGLYGFGSVFKLTATESGWIYSSLHDFTGGTDGGNPMCSLVFDTAGNLYGTASDGGANGLGVVFQIRP